MKQLLKIMLPALLLTLCIPAAQAKTQGTDISLMKSPAWVMQRIKTKHRIFLVDVRHKDQYAQFKIPGSLNLPLSRIKTKQFLKTRPLVLFNQGFVQSELIREAKILKKNGYTAYILQGGLLAWKHKGGTLLGNPFAPKELNKILPRDLLLEKSSENWIMVNAGNNTPTAKTQHPQKILHPLQLKPTPIEPIHLINTLLTHPAGLDKRLKLTAHTSTLRVVVLTETGQGYKELEKKIQKTYRHRVFFLEGGAAAYDTYLAHHSLATAPKSNRTQTIGECEPCKNKTKDQ